MSKIYLPEKLVLEQNEIDLYPYHRRVSTSFCVAFTLNELTEMYVGNRYNDSLDACLTAVSWIEDHHCEYETLGISLRDQNHDRIVKTFTIYIDRGGYIVSGQCQELKYNRHAIDDDSPKKTTLIHNFSRKFINGTKDHLLHKEIFIDKVFKIESFPEFKIKIQSDFYQLLKTVSIYNRSMEMSFVYSVAQGKKVKLEYFKKIASIVSIPITIEAYPWLKVLQEGISLINYLCTADSVMKLTDELFDFRGPIVISDVYDIAYRNKYFNPQENIIPKPIKETTYFSRNGDSALRNFMEIRTIVGNQIKDIKEPNSEI